MEKIRIYCNKKNLLSCLGIIITLLFIGGGILLFQFRQLLPLIPIVPTLLGFQGKQTYLVLFQNNAELRPGGGFIGSYAIATIQNGKLTSFIVHNVYDADGLLTKHIEPYYIGRRYIQVHLYMRDSNFDVDFSKSAQKAAYMLYEETGQKVDTIVGVDLSFARSLISVLSPIYIPEYNETMNANNFFILTETHADRYSFNGSTQKQDYLRALSNAIKMKIDTKKLGYYLQFLPKILDAISQKHLLLASNHPTEQQAFTQSNLSSVLADTRPNKPGTVNDFFGLNEANIGINKANYYLSRSIDHSVTINPSGIITEQVTLSFTNTSQHQAWPTGRYKAYIRLLLPLHTKLTGIMIDNQAQHLVPAITNFRVYEAPGFKPPQGLELDHSEEAGKTLYGFIVTVGILSSKTVTISYQLPDTLKITSANTEYNLSVFKQPGMNEDPYTFSLHYPTKDETHVSGTIHAINTVPGAITLFTPLATDQDIDILLRK